MITSMPCRIATSALSLLFSAGALAGPIHADATSTTSSASSASSSDGATLTIDTMAPGEVVLRVGLVGSYWQADSPANVSVYADGRVVVSDPDETLGYSTFLLTTEELDELLALAAAATPFDDVDYGEVMITDVGSTRVEVHADQGDAVVTVWALDHLDGLTADQQERRGRLIAVVGALESLGANTVEPYSSDDVVVELRPVLPGMDPDGTPVPWPLGEPPIELSSDIGFHSVCIVVPRADVEALPEEVDGEHLWSLPTGLGVATPFAVAASVTAVLPEQKPCETFGPVERPRPLSPDELQEPPHDWTSPWPQGQRTTAHPFEEWMAVDAMARTVLPAELGGDWEWNRWSWFDFRFAAADVDGRRVIDFRATCTDYVTDEEPACTIDARFDAVTGELLEFTAA